MLCFLPEFCFLPAEDYILSSLLKFNFDTMFLVHLYFLVFKFALVSN